MPGPEAEGQNEKTPAIGHGVTRIHGQIDDNLFKLARISANSAQLAAVADLQRHRFPKQPLQQLRNLRNDIGQLQNLWPQRLLPRQGEQLPRQAGSAIAVAFDLLVIVLIAVTWRMTHRDKIALSYNGCPAVVE